MAGAYSRKHWLTRFVPRWLPLLALVGSMQSQVASLAAKSVPPVNGTIDHAVSHSGNNFGVTEYPPMVAQAITVARARISASKKCQRFFGDRGLDTISQTIYSLQDLGAGNIAASANGYSVFLNLNPKGAFMNPPAGFAGRQSAEEIRGFYILHELAHELSWVTKFTTDHSASPSMNRFRHDNNDDLLKMNCY